MPSGALSETQRHLGQVHDEDRGVLRPHRHATHREGVGDQGLLDRLQPGNEDPVVTGHVEVVSRHRAAVLGLRKVVEPRRWDGDANLHAREELTDAAQGILIPAPCTTQSRIDAPAKGPRTTGCTAAH